MRITTSIILFIFLFGAHLCAQDIVEKQLKEYESASVDNKIILFHYFQTKINKDSLLPYIEDLQQIGIKQHRNDALAMSNYGMGYYLQTKSLLKEAESKLDKALNYYISIGNDTLTSDLYNQRGNTAFLEGNLTKAELLYNKSLDYAEQSGSKKYKMLSVPNLSKIYVQQGKFDLAEQEIRKYIQFQKDNNGNLRLLATAYGILGELHLNQEDYENAINDFNNSMEYGLMVGNMKTVANGYTNLGIVEYLSNNINRSEQYFRLALTYRLQDRDKYSIAEGYYNLGDFYSGIDKNDSAIVNYQKSASVAESTMNLRLQIDALSQLSTVYNYLGNKDREIETLKKVINLQDKVNKQQHEDVLNALGISYNQSLEEVKNLGEEREGILRSQIGKYQSVFNKWLIITLLGMFGLLVLIYFIRRKNRQVERVE